MNSRREISSRFTDDKCLVTQMAWCCFQPIEKRYYVEDWHLINSDQSLLFFTLRIWAWKMEKTMVSLQVFLSFLPRVPCLPNSPFPFKRLPWRLFQFAGFFFKMEAKAQSLIRKYHILCKWNQNKLSHSVLEWLPFIRDTATSKLNWGRNRKQCLLPSHPPPSFSVSQNKKHTKKNS